MKHVDKNAEPVIQHCLGFCLLSTKVVLTYVSKTLMNIKPKHQLQLQHWLCSDLATSNEPDYD